MLIKKNFLLSTMFISLVGNITVHSSMPIMQQSNIFSLVPSIFKSEDETSKKLEQIVSSVLELGLTFYINYKLHCSILEVPGFKVYQPGEIKENFSNIAGNQEAKELFLDIVEYLKDPSVYKAIGAKPVTGILLTGGPGTGKTLLARALAGEANCAFIYASGSEMDGKFLGSGADRIRKLFDQATAQYSWSLKRIPCIIFIDEFEVVAKHRGMSMYNWSDQTVNELLIQLDGFVKKQEVPVIVIAATNYPEKIDKAILRPGRIDRTIHFNNPDYQDRFNILKIHLHKVVHDLNINLNVIAQQTIGFSGAELEGIINSAARLAINRGASKVCQEDIQEAYELRVIGVASKRALTHLEKKIIAYHEAGHALSSILLMPNKIVNKITILPRGQTLGVTHVLLKDEVPVLMTKQDYLNEIAMLLAGRAAEDIVFDVITTGPSSDLQRATELAQEMLRYYGMGDNLVVETITESLEIETSCVAKILDTQYQRVKELLQNKIDSLTLLAKKLLEKNTLTEDEIKTLDLG